MVEIEVELTPEDYDRIDAAAERLGVDRDTFIRDAIAERLGCEADQRTPPRRQP